jgi:hypothetical protein
MTALAQANRLLPAGLRPPAAVLDFLPGWVHGEEPGHPGGLWRMSKRTRERVSRGQLPAFRREPFGEPNRPRDRTWRPGGLTTNAHAYPALVICPCGLHQVADEEVLALR